MRKQLNRKGFSLSEVLIVVAIIVVLAGVGFIALASHMRNMHQLEMDGQAKEIFVAAQNHLSLAKSQDYLDKDGFGTPEASETAPDSEKAKGIYYYVVSSMEAFSDDNSILTQMLPFASVDETARTGGSYIIRYQKDPGIVLDVFYSAKAGRYSHVLTASDYTDLMDKTKYYGEDKREERRKYGSDNSVIGWYGGETEGVAAGEKLKIPGVEIINGDKLMVKVTDYNDPASNGGTNELVLVVSCGSEAYPFKLKAVNPEDVYTGTRLLSPTGNTYTVVLDDITTKDDKNPQLHFCQLMPSAAGKDIQIYATSYNNNYLTNVAQSPVQVTNSLFAYDGDDDESTVQIASIRHLLNLDSAISQLVVGVDTATQISDLVWNDGNNDLTDKGSFLDNTLGDATQIVTSYYDDTTSIRWSRAGTYMPVNPPSALTYSGQAEKNHIFGIEVDCTEAAGLFSSLENGTVSDLELRDFNITSSGNAGALAGTVDGTEIIAVLVRNSKTGGNGSNTSGADNDLAIVSTGSSAGGLVGKLEDGSVNMCAAAVYVQGAANAGGLIGEAVDSEVSSSYAGGHTENARYQVASELLAATSTTSATNTMVNVIVTGNNGNVGGLIGKSEDTDIEYCYSTASASPYVDPNANDTTDQSAVGVNAGGLVGASKSGKVETCYVIGLVFSDSTGKASSIIGKNDSTTPTSFAGDNNYLEGVSDKVDNSGYNSIAAVSGVSANTDKSNFFVEEQQNAYPYDKTLVVDYGKTVYDEENQKVGDYVAYYFPTIKQLHALNEDDDWTIDNGTTDTQILKFRQAFLYNHYGDWQLPRLSPLNYMLVNGDTLDLVIELLEDTTQLTFAVSGETSGNTRIFTLDLARDDTNGKWTVTNAVETAAGPGFSQSASKNVTDYFAGKAKTGTMTADIPARFGAYEFAIPALAAYYDESFTGKRVYPATDTTEEKIFYDVKITLDDITRYCGHFAQLLSDKYEFAQTNDATPEPIYAQLLPGENITVRLGAGSGSWNELKALKYIDDSDMVKEKTKHAVAVTTYKIPADYHSLASSDNSVFALSSEIETPITSATNLSDMSRVDIALVRHLQNLDTSTSSVNLTNEDVTQRVTHAVLLNSIDWKSAKGNYPKIYNYSGEYSISGAINGIYNQYLTYFNDDGNPNTSNYVKLSNFVVGNTVNFCYYDELDNLNNRKHRGYNNAGLFRYVEPGDTLTVSDICLENLIVQGKDNVGSVIASNAGVVHLSNVLVIGEYNENDTLTPNTETKGIVGVLSAGTPGDTGISSAAAGGLVGWNQGTLTVNNCASAVYVTSNGPAGGLVGKNSGTVRIYKSYVGGHVGKDEKDDFKEKIVSVAEYYTDGVVGETTYTLPIRTEDGKVYMDANHRVQRWNIISYAGAAGGIIGETVEGSTTGIEKSFNTASVYASSKMGGGVIGVANGTFAANAGIPNVKASDMSSSLLDLVYTVAPVYSIKTTDSDDNGAVIGTHGSTTGLTSSDNPDIYYLADIYSEAEITQTPSGLTSNIKFIGSGTATNMKLASFFADKNDACAAIIGVLSIDEDDDDSDYTSLEQRTTAYDSILNGNKEFPFSLWTEFAFADQNGDGKLTDADKRLHFYGDWQPVDNEETTTFTFYFLMEDPENALPNSDMPVSSFPNQSGVYRMAVQLDPFQDALLSIPTIPYIPGYGYGYKEAGAADDALRIAWTVYYGDLSKKITSVNNNHASSTENEAKKFKEFTVEYVGGDIPLTSSSTVVGLTEAQLKNANVNYGNAITFVAHYTRLGTEKTFKLMDVNFDSSTAEKTVYKNVGGIQILDTTKSLKTLVADGSLYVPRRSHSGQRFLGWYKGTVSNGVVTLGDQVFKVNADGIVECVDETMVLKDDTVLFAKYEPIEEGTIQMTFILLDDKDNPTTLDVDYELTFDRKLGFNEEVTLPGSDTGTITGVQVMKVATAGADPQDITDTAEASFVKKEAGSQYHKSVKITVGPDTYPVEYIVYIRGSIVNSGYYIVCVKEDDPNTAAKMIWRTSPNHYPNITDADLAEMQVEGYKLSVLPKAPTRYSATNTDVEKYNIPAKGAPGAAADDQINTDYFFIATYSKDKFELSFENLGDSASSSTYRFRKLNFGESIATYADSTPVFEGHDFNGWTYKRKSDGHILTEDEVTALNSTMPGYDLVLKANWSRARVAYTVAFWFENPDDTDYSYVDKVQYSATGTDHPHSSEDIVYASEFNDPTEFSVLEELEDYMYFENNSGFDANGVVAQYDKGVVLKYDGSSVVNVYFKRKSFTFTFMAESSDEYYPDDNGIYGKFGDHYEELNIVNRLCYKDEIYNGTKYQLTTGTSGTQYGVAENAVKRLHYESKTTYTYTTTTYTALPDSDNTTSPQYRRRQNGEYQQLTWRNGSWQYQRGGSGNWTVHYGTRYKRTTAEAEFNGQVYVYESGWGYYRVEYYDNGGPYYGWVNGERQTLDKNTDTYWYYLNDSDEQVRYSGARYLETNSTTGEIYGWGTDGMLRLVNKQFCYRKNTNPPEQYTGQRYSRNTGGNSYGVVHTFTAKYEASIRDKWSFTGSNGVSYPQTDKVTSWVPDSIYNDDNKNHRILRLETMPGNDRTYYRYTPDDNRYTRYFYYYVESLGNGDHTYNGNYSGYSGKGFDYYLPTQKLDTDFNFATEAEDFFDLKGYTKVFATETKTDWSGAYEDTVTWAWVSQSGGGGYNRYPSSGYYYGHRFYYDSLENHAILNFYYIRNKYTLEMVVNGQTYKTYQGDGTDGAIKYGASLSAYDVQPTNNPDPNNYDFDGWYKDPNYTTRFDFSQTMPYSNIRIYGRWKHKNVTVTFNLNDPAPTVQPAAAMSAGGSASVEYGEAIGLVADDGSLKTEYKPTKNGYDFAGWYVGDDEFVYSSPIYETTELTAHWTKKADVEYATVAIRYKDYRTGNELDLTDLPSTVTLTTSTDVYLKDDSSGHIHGNKIVVGETFSMDVPDIPGYTRAGLPESTILVSDKNETIDLFYRTSGWELTIEYYFVYESVKKPANWIKEALGTEGTAKLNTTTISAPVFFHRVTKHVDNEFALLSYVQPTSTTEGWESMGDISWLKYYCFDRFVYGKDSDNKDREITGAFVTVNQDSDDVLKIYIKPDPDAMPINDCLTFYDGATKMDYQPDNPLDVTNGPNPALVTSSLVCKYYYYDDQATGANKYKLAGDSDTDKIKNAGTYGMREYLLVETGGQYYVIWQSDNDPSGSTQLGTLNTPPLHLYVRRRVVIMKSKSKSATYYEGICVTDHSDPDLLEGLTGVDLSDYAFGFATGEGADYVFSANAFRRVVGKTPNEFTYELWTETTDETTHKKTDIKNYNIFIRYGELEVKPAS